MINSIRFTNFKALEDFTIHLKDFNVLTGPNNNGKSTILDGLRVLQGAYRYASRYNPKIFKSPYGGTYYGYEIPESSIPIILENVQTNFNIEEPSVLTFKLEQGKILTLYFHNEHPIYLFFETPNRTPLSATSLRKEFPLNISIVPTLGPFEIEEETFRLRLCQKVVWE
jgi:predicted ATP-dependent endonuclease of OLD family